MEARFYITTDHEASSFGLPVCLLAGELVDPVQGFRLVTKRLGWNREECSRRTGKSVGSIDRYRSGSLTIPAEVWLVLRDSLSS